MLQLATKPDVRLTILQPPYRFESPFGGKGYVLLLHSDDPNIQPHVQSAFADQIVATGCRYACCSGVTCSSWHDAIDLSFVGTGSSNQRLEERFVMTTWHEQERLGDVVWFALNNTSFDDFVAERLLIVLLSPDTGREQEVGEAVAASAG